MEIYKNILVIVHHLVKIIIELDGMYHISTSKNEYYLNFYMVYKADDVPSDIGLSKIEIATEQTVNRENFMWDTSENGIFVVRE